MDRSLDSIGSCSLDVDADSSDISDTSGSLNFPTPLSVKDITREFTANIRERCALRPQNNTTTYVDPVSGKVCMVLTEPTVRGGRGDTASDINSTAQQTISDTSTIYEKKPSYLNLACCVNGYSNLTTYDSKIRRDINKSREVSPIRPSTSSLQYCKKNNSLAAPVLIPMPNVLMKQPAMSSSKYAFVETNNNINNNSNHNNNNNIKHHGNRISSGHQHNGLDEDLRRAEISATSFIQQRVERLYGPGALAQGFYSPKKHFSITRNGHLNAENQQNCSELAKKFKQLSPGKDYSEFRKKLDHNVSSALIVRQATADVVNGGSIMKTRNGDVDLPVFRHLSEEFRAQLPVVSPKRSILRESLIKETNMELNASTDLIGDISQTTDVVDHQLLPAVVDSENLKAISMECFVTTTKITPNIVTNLKDPQTEAVKDGNYFLNILKSEQTRLLALAAEAEKYIDALSNNPEVTEDTLGLLRAASGKAKLLVSQKMKQFEGLCHNNLNCSPEDKFPTTTDDLQGFWDMVNLQVDHIDSVFADIEKMKNNDWKRINESAQKSKLTKSQRNPKTGNAKPKTSTNANVNNNKTDAVKSAAALKREVQRKQIMEMKRKHREAMAAAANCKTDDETENNVVSVASPLGSGVGVNEKAS